MLEPIIIPIIWIAIGGCSIFCCLRIGKRAGERWLVFHERRIVHVITPPAHSPPTHQETIAFMTRLHSLTPRPLSYRLLGAQPAISLEIISTKTDGIRYVISTVDFQHAALQHALQAYMPRAHCSLASSSPASIKLDRTTRVATLQQTKHYVLPLAPHASADPLRYVIEAMTQLDAHESVTYQLIITPEQVSGVGALEQKLQHRTISSSDFMGSRQGMHHTFLAGVHATIFSLFSLFSSRASSSSPASPARSHEREHVEALLDKIRQPLFRVETRLHVQAQSSDRATERINTLMGAFVSFGAPRQQGLAVHTLRRNRTANRVLHHVHYHLPSLAKMSSNIFSVSELAYLYHFPPEDKETTENMIHTFSPTLAAPVSLKRSLPYAVTVGENTHHGVSTLIGLSKHDRERHMYIVGGTGNGKTTLMHHMIMQDIERGSGIAVIDPHGDLAEEIISSIPEDRLQDVIYFNPDDIDYPIGMNILELTPGLTGSDLLREKDIVTESVISIFRKIFSDNDSNGHRIEYILRNAIHTAFTCEAPTLFTVFDLLNDTTFRKKIVNNLDDMNLRNFWKNEFGKAGDMQRVKMAAGITSKIGRFLFSVSAKRILEQPQSTVNFLDCIDSGKILICNVSKGLIGEDTSALFGIIILAQLQLTALRRARIKKSARRAFYVYVDEFQNFATPSFVQMLSEARKYGLFLTMAEQSTSQQDDAQMVPIILANVGTIVCFRTGNPADEEYLLPLFRPYIAPGDIANLAAYTFYIKIASEHPQEPLSGTTVISTALQSNAMRARVIAQSRQQYAIRWEGQDAHV